MRNGSAAGALRYAMAAVLLGYFSTMVAALAVCMVLLNGFLTSSLMQRPKPQPYPVPVIAQAVVPEQPPSLRSEADNVRAPNAADKKSDRLDLARAQRRKQENLARKRELARQQPQQPDAMALSYNQEQSQQPAAPPVYNLFAPRRF